MESLRFFHGRRCEPKRPWRAFRWKWLLLGLVLPAIFCAGAASAQVVPELIARSNLSVYGTLPANFTPNFAPVDSSVLFGYSLGGFLQSPHIIGLELKGSIQRRINSQHQESALAGPRVALHLGRVAPYTSILFGAGNGWRFKDAPPPGEKLPTPVEGIGPQWTWSGGVDLRISRRFAVRAGEISRSELYLKHWNLSPLNATAGVVWRLR
jgi:hypothetical protein